MRQAQDNTELFIGLYTFCSRFNLTYDRVRYLSIKCRLRLFRFNGISYLESNNLLDLLKSYRDFLDGSVTSAIDYLNSLD